jgi:hypothetical protein
MKSIWISALVAALIVVAVFFRSQRKENTLANSAAIEKPPSMDIVRSAAPDAWHDIPFKSSVEQKPDHRVAHLRNTYNGKPLGFDVALYGTFRNALHSNNGKAELDAKALEGLKVVLLRSGPESDEFLRVLDDFYGTKQSVNAMVPSFELQPIPLQGENEGGLAKIKLFGNTDSETEYFEVYLNVNFKEGWAELAEKDPDYRLPMVRTLGKR